MATRKMNVFEYANACERVFTAQTADNGYQRKTTFYSDLSIAEFCQMYMGDSNAIVNTYNNVMKSWLDNIEYITEFVMCLNYKIWQHYDNGKGNETIARLYSTLWRQADEKVADHYKNDPKALDYFYSTLD